MTDTRLTKTAWRQRRRVPPAARLPQAADHRLPPAALPSPAAAADPTDPPAPTDPANPASATPAASDSPEGRRSRGWFEELVSAYAWAKMLGG